MNVCAVSQLLSQCCTVFTVKSVNESLQGGCGHRDPSSLSPCSDVHADKEKQYLCSGVSTRFTLIEICLVLTWSGGMTNGASECNMGLCLFGSLLAFQQLAVYAVLMTLCIWPQSQDAAFCWRNNVHRILVEISDSTAERTSVTNLKSYRNCDSDTSLILIY